MVSVLHVVRRWGLVASLSFIVFFVGLEIRLFHASFENLPEGKVDDPLFREIDQHDVDSPYYFENYDDDYNKNRRQIPQSYPNAFLPRMIDRHDESFDSPHETMKKGSNIHRRVACFNGSSHLYQDSSCESFGIIDIHATSNLRKGVVSSSIPQLTDAEFQTHKRYQQGTSSEDAEYALGDETDTCKYPDPSFQSTPAAPSTCNDIHSLGFDLNSFSSKSFRHHKVKYVTSGAFRSVWSIKLYEGEDRQNTFIFKTNRISRSYLGRYLDQQRRDGLISERAGRSPYSTIVRDAQSNSQFADIPMKEWNNVLPVYHLCAFTNVVPFATADPLDDYIEDYTSKNKGKILPATDILRLALQAARGLYQMQTYVDGKPSFAHADIKPAQFLAYNVPNQRIPILQISDFNRGRFLTRSVKTSENCPFRICNVKHKGSPYRSPEEYRDCADQSDRIDVFSLGGIFFYLLTDGMKPNYKSRSYDRFVKNILNEKLPSLPKLEEYEEYGDDIVNQIRDRAEHPAYKGLKEVMIKCWAFKPQNRPSSLEVVRMLEEKLRQL